MFLTFLNLFFCLFSFFFFFKCSDENANYDFIIKLILQRVFCLF